MELHKLAHMTKGWFIGNFQPSLFITNDFEVAVKYYSAGDLEDQHYHKISTEYTVIVDGEVEMNDQYFQKGDIIVIKPNESTNFKALTDTTTVVVKMPCADNDKYIGAFPVHTI